MTEQELDLLLVTTGLATELRAGTAQVMSAEVLDSNLFRSFGNHGPNCPVAQALYDLAALADGPKEPAFLDPGCGLPGDDAVLDPVRDRYGADAPAFAGEVGDDPAVLPHLDVFHRQRGQFPFSARHS